MQLTQYSDYSLRILIYLASKPEGFATISELADFYQISRNHLMKVVPNLANHHFIITVRGKGGGMRLAKSPAQISVGDVIRHTEPNFYIAECFGGDNHCVITAACGLKGILNEALQNFWKTLDGYTLADVAPKTQDAQRVLLQGINLHKLEPSRLPETEPQRS